MSEKIQQLLHQAANETDGKSSISAASRDFPSDEEAETAFARFGQKIYHVERWNDVPNFCRFELFGESGAPLQAARAETGKFIRLELPGSGKPDWVKIIGIRDAANEIVVSVRPTYDPTETDAAEKSTSHFFTDDSTNNFCLQKDRRRLSFYVIGLHEKTNISETGGVMETIRNVATAGAGWLGFQKIQWKTFCENFLELDKTDAET